MRVTHGSYHELTFIAGANKMVIVEAIKSAASEHAVFFLVTAYLESLRHLNVESRIPEYVVRLPVRGERDLRERMSMIGTGPAVPAEAVYPVREASLVFQSALERLEPVLHCVRENR